MPVLTLDQIESLCADALKRAGASDEQAAIVAEEIMDAEAMLMMCPEPAGDMILRLSRMHSHTPLRLIPISRS